MTRGRHLNQKLRNAELLPELLNLFRQHGCITREEPSFAEMPLVDIARRTA